MTATALEEANIVTSTDEDEVGDAGLGKEWRKAPEGGG